MFVWSVILDIMDSLAIAVFVEILEHFLGMKWEKFVALALNKRWKFPLKAILSRFPFKNVKFTEIQWIIIFQNKKRNLCNEFCGLILLLWPRILLAKVHTKICYPSLILCGSGVWNSNVLLICSIWILFFMNQIRYIFFCMKAKQVIMLGVTLIGCFGALMDWSSSQWLWNWGHVGTGWGMGMDHKRKMLFWW